jgi:Lrp/AsnC family leucine-responsive transcriptional regulator
MQEVLDPVDYSILNELRIDSKLSIKDLASKLKVHPNTLVQRLEKLKKSGIIMRSSAEIDYSKVGYDLHVIIMIRVKKGRAGDNDQIADLVKLKEVQSLYATTGSWDLIAICRVKDRAHLLEVISEFGKNPIVLKTSSQLVLHTYKNPSDFNPFETSTKK